MHVPESPLWHQQEATALCRQFAVQQKQGLTAAQVAQAREQYGANILPAKKPLAAWRRLLRQFNNLLIYVLLVAAVLAGLLAEYLDAAVILAVVVVNATIGFVQEGQAEKALHAIGAMLSSKARVLRSGVTELLPASELVPGDIVILEAGDKVPADMRLLLVFNLQVQEAALTGESVAVAKHSAVMTGNVVLADRRNMVYSGTLVSQGRAVALVVATGTATELGRINQMLSSVAPLTTPLVKQISTFARYQTLIVLLMAILVFVLGYLRDYSLNYLFMAVVSLVVAAIPEGLPTILTVALAIGVTRMAKRNAIIRRLPAVETLGAVSVICSDKTGTLTLNEMMVSQIVLPGQRLNVSGSGYSPAGTVGDEDQEATDDDINTSNKQLSWLCRAALLCNDARLTERDNSWHIQGDPMEAALLVLAEKAGLERAQQVAQFPRHDEIPFDAAHKYMATLHSDHQGRGYILLKGAPEAVLALCSSVYVSDTEAGEALDMTDWQQQVEHIARDGQRVLALAIKCLDAQQTLLNQQDLETGVQLLGLVGLIDPPRPEAISAIASCQQAGIRVKMITGDHAATAAAIAAQLGLANSDIVITGAELDKLNDRQLAERIAKTAVFARATPEHKLRLVTALQLQGEVVAMTGDGVNDAPALKRANVGIAMGQGGTEAAREASEMVLLDDNFATIARAVAAGRNVYDNLKKAIAFILPVNGGESLAIILALLLAVTLPIMPLQILWVNMVSSIGLALALAFEPPEHNLMQRPPRPIDEALVSRFVLWRVLLVSVLFTTGIFAVFNWAIAQQLSVDYARTMAVNTLVAMEVWYLFSVRYMQGPSLSLQGIKGTKPVLMAVTLVFGLQLLFTYQPHLQQLFNTEPLQFKHGLICVAVGVVIFALLELEKWLKLRRTSRQQLS
ncbi:plasma-membrane calcium-translocating P-type ATPase/potassium and/or sodium efflux P-type ATPase,TIGR01523 [Arsukibacterium tuosuense]|uniref:Plasma-membrane calcium-translocating P-type ATPase/potassium and/or sodium efflux P-type ATPase,TIGR01523 n=1 Tax=Arsukibacterium tuosuense TaxID=1323745 RepID=A0A285IC52_9GAMM|nr:HAD-IC family P-type ATPase [Arsukibacterium tuosuense]SNY45555.1 plasma-membrane calcium-translocating P-type ATPase/potassium and/or sodium efflux P-type ATPase,TIGR01523 [Arsukibacterium tuosuense]